MKKVALAELTGRIDCGLMILADGPAFYFGTSPNKFFDYLAAGIPILNNYSGWLAGLIQNNQCGVVVPPGRPEALADGLMALAAKAPEERRQMGLRGRALAEREFARDTLAARFTAVLEETATLSR